MYFMHGSSCYILIGFSTIYQYCTSGFKITAKDIVRNILKKVLMSTV